MELHELERQVAHQAEQLEHLQQLWCDPLIVARHLAELEAERAPQPNGEFAEAQALARFMATGEAAPARGDPPARTAVKLDGRTPGFPSSRAWRSRERGSLAAASYHRQLARSWRRAEIAAAGALALLALLAVALDASDVDPFGSPGAYSWSPPALLFGILILVSVAVGANRLGRH